MPNRFSPSRRQVLEMMGRFGAAAPMMTSLLAAGAGSAKAATGDYKALVCVFLFGGNDCHNTIIPLNDEHHGLYLGARESVAVGQNDLFGTEIMPASGWAPGRQFAFHPNLSPLKTLFDRGQLSVLMNVGTLTTPVTAQDVALGRNLPPKLFSHNDQFTYWQSMSVEGATSGWGGRLGELLSDFNTGVLPMTMVSTAGQSSYVQGNELSASLVSPAGPVIVDRFNGDDDFSAITMANLLNASPTLLGSELSRQAGLAEESEALITQTISGTEPKLVEGASGSGNGDNATSDLHEQLNMVARIIAGRGQTGVCRQVFFCSLGGFDSHGNLNTTHPKLLSRVGDALLNFQNAIDALGLSENVTTFTASDFGRALTTNGRGSDHGWGGHHFVMGGDVKPLSWAGALPSFETDGPDDAGQGRLIPAISVDQYAAALSKWMGVSDSVVADVAPNIGNFDDIYSSIFKSIPPILTG